MVALQKDFQKAFQKDFHKLSDDCCYFCCICYLAKPEITLSEMLKVMAVSLDKKWIDEECFVKEPAKIYKLINYKDTFVTKEETNTTGKTQIARFYNPRTGYSHFVVADNSGVIMDPLGESITVKEGIIKD